MDAEPGDRLLGILSVALIIGLFLAGWHGTGYELVPGVWTHDLGPCALDWHRNRLTLVVACQGQDMIRVWPLPVVQPWFEDAAPARPAPLLPGCAARLERAYGRQMASQDETASQPALLKRWPAVPPNAGEYGRAQMDLIQGLVRRPRT